MNAQHTPMPWKLETVKTSCGICHKIGEFPAHPNSHHGPGYACVYDDHPGGAASEELLANARLIAAAPEMEQQIREYERRINELRVMLCDVVDHIRGFDCGEDAHGLSSWEKEFVRRADALLSETNVQDQAPDQKV